MIDFNGMSTHLGLFYASRLEICINVNIYIYIFCVVVS